MSETACLSAGTGRAVVTTPHGRFMLRVGDPTPHLCEETEVANFLSLARDGTVVAADAFPFSDVARELEKRWRVARALDYFVSTLDTVLPPPLRQESARRADQLLANDPALAVAIRHVFFNTKLPAPATVLLSAEIAEEANAKSVSTELRSAFALSWCLSGAQSRWLDADAERQHEEFTRSALIFGRFAEAVRENRSFGQFAAEVATLAQEGTEVAAVVEKWLSSLESLYEFDARYITAVNRRVPAVHVRAHDGTYFAHWAPFSIDTWQVEALSKNGDGTWSVVDSSDDIGGWFYFDALPVRVGESAPYPMLALRSDTGNAFAEINEDGLPMRVLSRELGALHVLACMAVDAPPAETVVEILHDIDHLMARSHTPMRQRLQFRLGALIRSRPQYLTQPLLVAKTFQTSSQPFEARLTVLWATLNNSGFDLEDPKNANTIALLQANASILPLPQSVFPPLDRLVTAVLKHEKLDVDDLADFVLEMWKIDCELLPSSTRRAFVPLLDHASRFLVSAAEASSDAGRMVDFHHAAIVAKLMISRVKNGSEKDSLSSRLGNAARAMTRADHLRFFEDRADRIDAGMLRELDIAVERIPLAPDDLLRLTKDDARRPDPTVVVTSAGIVLRYAAQAQYDILNHATEALALLQRATVYFAAAAAMEPAKDKWLYTHWARGEALRGRILARSDRNRAIAAFESAQSLANHQSIANFDPYAFGIHRAEITAIKLEHVGTREQTLAETDPLINDLKNLTRLRPGDASAWNVLWALYKLRGEASSALEILDEWGDMWTGIDSRRRESESVRYRAAEFAMQIARDNESALPVALKKYIALIVEQPGNLLATSELLALLRAANDEVRTEVAEFAAERLPPLTEYACKTPHALVRIILLDEGVELTRVRTVAQALAAFVNGSSSLRDEARSRIIKHWTRFLAEALEYLTREVFHHERAAFGARSRDTHTRLERIDALLDVCLSMKPRDAIWLTRKADIALMRGMTDPAALAKHILTAVPHDAILRLKASQLMIRGHRLSEAEAILNEEHSDEAHPAILDRRALLAMLRGDFELSLNLYDQLLARNALDSTALWGWGRLAVERGELEDAFGAWLQALRVRSLSKTARDTHLSRRTAVSLAALCSESNDGSLLDLGAGVPSLYMRAVWEEPATVTRSLIEALGTAGLTDSVTRQAVLDATGTSPDSMVARQVAQYLLTSVIDGALRPDANLHAVRATLELSIEWTKDRRVFGDFIAGAKREYARAILRHGWRGEMPRGVDVDVLRSRLTSTELELLEHVASMSYSPDYYDRAYNLSARMRSASGTLLNDFVLLLVYTIAHRIRELSPIDTPLQRVIPAVGVHVVSVARSNRDERLTVSGDADALGELSRRFASGPWQPTIEIVEATISRAPTLVESRTFANFGIFFRETEETYRCYVSRLFPEAA